MFYKKLWGLYTGSDSAKGFSGFAPEAESLPYISLQNLGHSRAQAFSTLLQEEILTYSFVCYGRTYKEVSNLLLTVKQDYTATSFVPVDPKVTVVDLEWTSISIKEIDEQVFGGTLLISLWINREPDLVKIADKDLTPFPGVFEAIKARWEGYKLSTDPTIYLGGFVPGQSEIPYLSIVEDRQFIEGYATTNRVEKQILGFDLFIQSLSGAETMSNLLLNVFNHSQFILTNSTNLGMNFIQTIFEEVYPSLWKIQVSFSVTSNTTRVDYVS